MMTLRMPLMAASTVSRPHSFNSNCYLLVEIEVSHLSRVVFRTAVGDRRLPRAPLV